MMEKPSNEFVLEIWHLIKDVVAKDKREESAERLFNLVEEYGADPEELKELLDEDPTLDYVWHLLYADEYEDEEEDSYEEYN